MQATSRQYDHAADYDRVGRFLVRTYRGSGEHVNWLQPRWEYMHFHPLIRGVDLGSFGAWEADGEIVGVVHPEHEMGTAYFEMDPAYRDLRGEMLRHAEEHLRTSREGVPQLRVYINDEDDAFQDMASGMGYVRGDGAEPPDGNFVAYCGMWYEPVHSVAYVEPVATDPDFRRMGLARAAVMEGIRRCGELGATVAYVGTTMPLYLSLGFRRIYGSSAWQRGWA